MSEQDIGIRLSAETGADGSKVLVFEGAALEPQRLQRSATLRGLLNLDGEATLQIKRSSFLLWSTYSESRFCSVPELAELTEV